MDPASIALALGSSLSAGLNLYLTVFALGLLERVGWLQLPPDLQILSHTWVLVLAGTLFLVEFVADKIPYVDNTWDSFHTFIRVPAGAVLAVSAMGFADMPAHILWIAGLLGGFVSFTSHGAKATTRLAVNSTPEPFTNWFLSFVEDAVVLGVMWLIANHPEIAIILALLLLGLFLAVIFLFFKLFKAVLRRRGGERSQTA